MLNEISNYFDICLEGIIKTVTLPIGILGIISKYLIKESKWYYDTRRNTRR